MRRARLCWGIAVAVLGAAWLAPAAMAQDQDFYPIGTNARVTANTTHFLEDTAGAGTQAGEPLTDCGRTVTHTVWYRLTNVTGPLRISTDDPETTFDTVVSVYEATPGGSPGAFVDCDDDGGKSGFSSDFIAPTKAGRDYMVQVGGCGGCNTRDFGEAWVTFVGNDSRLAAEEFTNGQTGDRTNWYATVSPNEVHSCRGTGYDATVWFRFRSPAKGKLTFTASATETAVAIYRGSSQTPAACSADPIPGAPGSRATLDTVQGTYYIQVGGQGVGEAAMYSGINMTLQWDRSNDQDGDNHPAPAQDCDDSDPRRYYGAFDIPFNGFDENCDGRDSKDGDDDHFDARPFGNDCNDGDHGINPTAREVPGNTVDENCDDRKAPGNLAQLSIDLKANRYAPGKLIFGRLRVSPVRAGYKISVKCKGGRSRGCKRTSLTKRIRRGGSFQTSFTYAKVLRNGASFDVTVTWPGRNRVGQFKRFSVRGGRLRQTTCAMVPTDETGRAFRRSCG